MPSPPPGGAASDPGDARGRWAGGGDPADDDPLPLGVEVVGREPPRLGLTGELDHAGVAEVLAGVRAAVRGGRPVEIDIRGLTFIDSTGSEALLRAAALATAEGASGVRFLLPDEGPVARMLRLAGVHRVLAAGTGAGP